MWWNSRSPGFGRLSFRLLDTLHTRLSVWPVRRPAPRTEGPNLSSSACRPGILASPTGTSRKHLVLDSSHPKLQAAMPGPPSPRDPILTAFRSENPPVLCALETQSTGRTHHAASSPAPPLLRDRRSAAEAALSPGNPDEIPCWFPNPRETLLRATAPPTPKDLDNTECVPNDAPEKERT